VTDRRPGSVKGARIYFSGSIRGGREDQEIYHDLIVYLQRYGEVLTEHIGGECLTVTGEGDLPDERIHQRDLGWVRSADILVAEVTTPSLGVGYEIGVAEQMGKPILCLHRSAPGRRLSAMIAGNPHLHCRRYAASSEAERIIDHFFDTLDPPRGGS